MWHSDTAATHKHEVWSRLIWQRIMEAKLMRADEVLCGIWSIWSFIKYEVVNWYWMRRDHHTGWMVPCSLQPVYAEKYVKWKLEGEVCVDVRLLVFFDWRAVSWRWRRRSRNVYQSACRRGIFVCFTCFPLLGCVFVRNGVVWRIHFILCFFSCFFVTVSILYSTRSHYSQFS